MKIHILWATLLMVGCAEEEKIQHEYYWDSKVVIASAYNSTKSQTSAKPYITAFGDSLKPGDKYIAVSRDLLKNGLAHNTEVVIEGLDGIFMVKDKMHRKWKNHIDIYMGNDVKAAREWGRRKLCIDYKLTAEKWREKHNVPFVK